MSARPDDELFREPARERELPVTAIAIAGLAVAILVGVLLMLGHRNGEGVRGEQPLAAYAPSLMLKNLQMSQSDTPLGGKDTYIDGQIVNQGQKTVTGVTLQVFFHNDEQMKPQIETVPVWLIRSRQPEIDTEAVKADPLTPGSTKEFRLIFENIGTNWNQSLPDIHVINVETR